MKPTLQSCATVVREYLMMTFGMACYAFGWIGCILPAHGVGGGCTGLALLISSAFRSVAGIDIRIGTLVLLLNALLLLAAGFIIGWRFGIKTIYCIGVLSIMMNLLQEWLPAGEDLLQLDNRLLLVILGGLLVGLGIALCFRNGGSTGGTDIAAMIINKYRTISYGKVIAYSDLVIIGSSLLVGYRLDSVIYGYILTVIVGATVDLLMAGNHQSSQLFIICRDCEAMADAMLHQANRGATLIDATGWYSKRPAKIVMVVCRKRDTSMLLKIAKTVDPDAFITVGSVMGVYGKGFETLTKI